MNFFNFLLVLLGLLFGTKGPVYDLRKKPTKEDYIRNFNCWVQRNFGIIVFLTMIALLVIFVIVCYMFVGVSAVESGNVYNHFMDVI